MTSSCHHYEFRKLCHTPLFQQNILKGAETFPLVEEFAIVFLFFLVHNCWTSQTQNWGALSPGRLVNLHVHPDVLFLSLLIRAGANKNLCLPQSPLTWEWTLIVSVPIADKSQMLVFLWPGE